MKKLPNLLKALLLGAVFFCFLESNQAQCAKNQYAIGVDVNTYEQSDPANNTSYEFCSIETTETEKVFNRIDFTFSARLGFDYCPIAIKNNLTR